MDFDDWDTELSSRFLRREFTKESLPVTDTFWMVYGPERGAPTKPHKSYQEASDEAARLAVRYPGKQFVILEARTVVKTVEPAVEYRGLSNPPTVPAP